MTVLPTEQMSKCNDVITSKILPLGFGWVIPNSLILAHAKGKPSICYCILRKRKTSKAQAYGATQRVRTTKYIPFPRWAGPHHAPPSHAACVSSSVQNNKAERDLGQEISGYSKLLHKMLGQAFGCSLWLVLEDTGIAKATPA